MELASVARVAVAAATYSIDKNSQGHGFDGHLFAQILCLLGDLAGPAGHHVYQQIAVWNIVIKDVE